MINDLKYIDGVLYQLTPLSKQWVPVPGQERKPDAVRLSAEGERFVYYGGREGGKSRVQELLIREAQIAVLKEQLASAEADARIKGANLEQTRKELRDKVDCWKRIAANRKERNNALAEMLRAERAKVIALESEPNSTIYIKTVQNVLAAYGYNSLKQACSAADSARAALSRERETVRLLRYALEKMIDLANCFIPAGRTNSIVDNAIKVLQDTK